MDRVLFWWVYLLAPPHFKLLLWIFLSCTGQCIHSVWQPLLVGERHDLHAPTAVVHPGVSPFVTVRNEPAFLSLSQSQVSDIVLTNRPKLSYSRRDLLSLNANQSDLAPGVISRLRELHIGYRLPRKRSCRGGRRKQRQIKVSVNNHPVSPPDPLVASYCSDQCVASSTQPRERSSLITIDTNPKRQFLTVCHFNAQSVAGNRSAKRGEIELFVRDESVDILLLTETWLCCQGDEAKCVDMTPPGYTLRSFPRATRGGGVAFLLRNTVLDNAVITTTFPFSYTSFELAQLTITSIRSPRPVNIFCMYRPPPSRKNESSHSIFLSEFSDFLELCNLLSGQLLITGDLNVHFDCPSDPVTARVVQLLQMFDLSQAVDVPTHRRGHTLDPVIYRERDGLFRSCSVHHALSSDHAAVMCYLDAAKPPHRPVFQTVRNLRNLDHVQFRTDVAAALSGLIPTTADDLMSALRSVLDTHAPPSRRQVMQRRSSPWYPSVSSELRALKRERRKAEMLAGHAFDGPQRDHEFCQT
ncbi:hypothetical protein BaRGS_00004780 [Batillaria attramentaria]|uniref:Endonuclease/exonuclease/phosphatase domain-containing protein n=1 Tax=Batillaria attramentaria TaxID=370345 RepID=A0ABD0LY28_9CAEN